MNTHISSIESLDSKGPSSIFPYTRAVVVKFGAVIGRRTLILLIGSCGMYIAAPAFLPSSFAMCLGIIAMGAWFQKDYTVRVHIIFYTCT